MVQDNADQHPPTVLITGAAAGVGRAAALRFARAGWRCVLVDANASALARVGDELPAAGGAPHLLRLADLTDEARVRALAQDLPALDALINNAGISDPGASALQDLEEGTAARLLALNLAAPARLVQACTPQLRAGARIVNVVSGAGLRAIPWRGLYSPSKAGLIAQTQALAQARPDWTVTALSPGFVRTELVQGLIDAGRLQPAQALAKVPLGRMAEPAEMAEALFFLAGTGARPLSGQVLVLDGGSSVYGGSHPLPPAEAAPRPADLPLALQTEGLDAAWAALAASIAPVATGEGASYAAVLDGSVLSAPPGGALAALQRAAGRFVASHPRDASLTLLLPAASPGPWSLAGDLAAARMLVATLAAEWGARALRINALEVGHAAAPADGAALLRFVAGAGAQYLTGQILRLAPGAPEARP